MISHTNFEQKPSAIVRTVHTENRNRFTKQNSRPTQPLWDNKRWTFFETNNNNFLCRSRMMKFTLKCFVNKSHVPSITNLTKRWIYTRPHLGKDKHREFHDTPAANNENTLKLASFSPSSQSKKFNCFFFSFFRLYIFYLPFDFWLLSVFFCTRVVCAHASTKYDILVCHLPMITFILHICYWYVFTESEKLISLISANRIWMLHVAAAAAAH